MDCYTLNEKLVAAIQNHDIGLVESLISQGADVNYATSMEGFTPLIFSILANDMEIMKFLLKKGADPYKTNSVIGGGAISAITFSKYVLRNENLARFIENCYCYGC